MTRSRLRKIKRTKATHKPTLTRRSAVVRTGVPVASMLLACMHAAYAADAADVPTLQEVVVTAQKRVENLQDVPLSIQAIGTQQLERLHVTNFNDYVKYLPSVS